MEHIVVTRKEGGTYRLTSPKEGTQIKEATLEWGLQGDNLVRMSIESATAQAYDIGDHFSLMGRRYTLNNPPRVHKQGAHRFSYQLTFEAVQYDLLRALYEVSIETTGNSLQDVQGDALMGDLKRFATVLVANANRVFPGKWELGDCPEGGDSQMLTFSDNDNCLSVLHTLCDTFGVEVRFGETADKCTIHFVPRVGSVRPFVFEFGKGKGLYALERQNVDNSNVITRLKVYGSTENISYRYRSARLCLPGKRKSESFIQDEEQVKRFGIHEACKIFDEVKPAFKGKITKVGSDVLSFEDKQMFDLKAKDADGQSDKYIPQGITPKVRFNTGNLAGYEFEIVRYNHASRMFTIKSFQNERGYVFPSKENRAYQFGAGDEYIIVDAILPERYLGEAEQTLLEKGTEYYRQNSQPKVKYGLKVSKQYVEKLFPDNGDALSSLFTPGDYIRIKDPDLQVDKSIRIQSLRRNLLDPYDYSLTIADTAESNITERVISELVQIDKITTTHRLKDPLRARSHWRSARDVMNMVFDPEGNYYTEKIRPNSIDTVALSVGAKSMQFALKDVVFEPNYGGKKNSIKVSDGLLVHYTVSDKPREWAVTSSVAQMRDDHKAYYIFARCPWNQPTATIVYQTDPITPKTDTAFYFWIGVLNVVDPDLQARSLSLTYGFSTINGGFITTGRIQSADGSTFFDLDQSTIAGNIMFIARDGSLQSVREHQEALRKIVKDVSKNALRKETLIEGGFVKTGLIDTQTLVARNIMSENGRFYTTEDGSVHGVGATFEEATIRSGSIAGFKIEGNGLSNDPFTNDAYVVFRNDRHKTFAGIGGNILPLSSGVRAVARFSNEEIHESWMLETVNTAMVLSAKNATYNFAFSGTGNGVLNGWIDGYKFCKATLTAGNTTYGDIISIKEGNRWIVFSRHDGSGVVIPRLRAVQQALSVSSTENFCVRLTILADLYSRFFRIYGRNNNRDRSNRTPWNNEQIPVLTHWDGRRWDYVNMGTGDSVDLLLIYDRGNTSKIDHMSLQYTARVINRQD